MAQTNLATADLDEGFAVTLRNMKTGEDTDVVIRVMVISWDNVCIGGRVIECTYDNAVRIYTKYPWILHQVFDATAHLYGYVDWMHYLDRFNRGKIPQFRARKWVAFNKLAALGDFKAAADAGAFNPGCLELRPRSPGQAVRGLALLDFEASLLDPLCVGLELRPHGRLPLWDGRPIKRLVVIGAAPGDQFIMGRYLRGLCERAEHVSVITEHSLVTLFRKYAPPAVDIVDSYDCEHCLNSSDAYTVGESLPHVSGQGYGNAGWIIPDKSLLQDMTVNPARVGIAWTGNPRNPCNWLRTVPIGQLSPLFKIPGIEWHSLQVGPKASECPKRVIDHAHELHDFADTVGLIATLDLVISVDTSVANMAGAMGYPLWVLVEPPGESDYRWGLSGESTPWFSSARVFRQVCSGARSTWDPVIKRVAAALHDWIDSRSVTSSPFEQCDHLTRAGRLIEADRTRTVNHRDQTS